MGQFKRFEPALPTKEIQVMHSQTRRSLASLASLLIKEMQMNPPRNVITSTAERLGLNILKQWILVRTQSSGDSHCAAWNLKQSKLHRKTTMKNSHFLHTYLLEQNFTTTFLLIDPNTHDTTRVSINRAVNEYTALPVYSYSRI